jgi:hypothetical protein
MSYKLSTFIGDIQPGDRNIQIVDENGAIRYTINPFTVTNVYQNNNLLKIHTRIGNTLVLDFPSVEDANSAVSKLQSKIDLLNNLVPISIQRDIQNYIDNLFGGGFGITGPTGPIGPTGFQGATGPTGSFDFFLIDGGFANSTYGGVPSLDGGTSSTP